MGIFFRNQCDDTECSVWKIAGEQLEFEPITGIANDFLSNITFSGEEIKKRQELFADIFRMPEIINEFEDLSKMLDDIKDIRSGITRYSSKDNEDALYNLTSFSIYFEFINKAHRINVTYSDLIESERLTDFFCEIERIRNDEKTREISEYIDSISARIKYTRSLTLCVNLNNKFEPYEIGILDFHGVPFTSSSAITKLLSSEDKLQVRHITPLLSASNNSYFTEAIYRFLNDEINKSLRKKINQISTHFADFTNFMFSIKNELNSIVTISKNYIEHRKRYTKIVFPEISSDFSVYKVYSQKLISLNVQSIVPNDIIKTGNQNMYLLTGANSGGKSIFLNMVGISQILFQLGLPLFALSAKMRIFKKCFCHFTISDNASGESRFVNECRRMSNIISKIDSESLVLMDESFSSTGDDEGTEVAVNVLNTIKQTGAVCFFSTHLHSLGNQIKKDELKMLPMRIKMNGETATHEIEYGEIDDYSHAVSIARKYGLVNN